MIKWEFWQELKETIFLGEPVSSLILFALFILVALFLRKLIGKLVTKLSVPIANRFSEKNHAPTFESLVRKPLESLIMLAFLYVAFAQLDRWLAMTIWTKKNSGPEVVTVSLGFFTDKIFLLVFIITLFSLISRIIDFIFYLLMHKARIQGNNEKLQLYPILKDVFKILSWILSAFWILGSVFAVNIPALITGIGIGGIAIALAAKETVENFFASFLIFTDKPFQTGDTIIINNYEGVVERVGFRSTRIRNSNNTILVVPNKNMIGQNVENLSDRSSRRIRFSMRVGYGTQTRNIELIMQDIRNFLEADPVVQNPIDVYLEHFQENVVEIFVQYYLPVPLPQGAGLLQFRSRINLKIYEILHRYTKAVPSGTSSILSEEAESKSTEPGKPDSKQ